MHATDLAVNRLDTAPSYLVHGCRKFAITRAAFCCRMRQKLALINLYARRESICAGVSKSYLVSFVSAIRPKSGCRPALAFQKCLPDASTTIIVHATAN